MSDDLSDHYALMKEQSKLKRAANRQGSAEILTARGIEFESKNGGAHRIFRGGTPSGRGVMNLIRLLNTTGDRNE